MLKENIIKLLNWYEEHLEPGSMAQILEPQITASKQTPEQIYYQQKMARIEAQILMVR